MFERSNTILGCPRPAPKDSRKLFHRNDGSSLRLLADGITPLHRMLSLQHLPRMAFPRPASREILCRQVAVVQLQRSLSAWSWMSALYQTAIANRYDSSAHLTEIHSASHRLKYGFEWGKNIYKQHNTSKWRSDQRCAYYGRRPGKHRIAIRRSITHQHTSGVGTVPSLSRCQTLLFVRATPPPVIAYSAFAAGKRACQHWRGLKGPITQAAAFSKSSFMSAPASASRF